MLLLCLWQARRYQIESDLSEHLAKKTCFRTWRDEWTGPKKQLSSAQDIENNCLRLEPIIFTLRPWPHFITCLLGLGWAAFCDVLDAAFAGRALTFESVSKVIRLQSAAPWHMTDSSAHSSAPTFTPHPADLTMDSTSTTGDFTWIALPALLLQWEEK